MPLVVSSPPRPPSTWVLTHVDTDGSHNGAIGTMADLDDDDDDDGEARADVGPVPTTMYDAAPARNEREIATRRSIL